MRKERTKNERTVDEVMKQGRNGREGGMSRERRSEDGERNEERKEGEEERREERRRAGSSSNLRLLLPLVHFKSSSVL